jgi:hypothetical protein
MGEIYLGQAQKARKILYNYSYLHKKYAVLKKLITQLATISKRPHAVRAVCAVAKWELIPFRLQIIYGESNLRIFICY